MSYVNHTGFRKKLAIYAGISCLITIEIGAVIQIARSIYFFFESNFSPTAVFTPEMLTALVTLSLGLIVNYTVTKALPGSPEYTSPELRKYDPTLKSDDKPQG